MICYYKFLIYYNRLKPAIVIKTKYPITSKKAHAFMAEMDSKFEVSIIKYKFSEKPF